MCSAARWRGRSTVCTASRTQGNVDVWNSGTLFGAIDVTMFVLIIGGFLGVTMKSWGHPCRDRLGGGETPRPGEVAVPDPDDDLSDRGDDVRDGGGDPRFYALIITVMLAAGYDGLAAGALILLGAGIGVMGSTINPFATGIARTSPGLI